MANVEFLNFKHVGWSGVSGFDDINRLPKFEVEVRLNGELRTFQLEFEAHHIVPTTIYNASQSFLQSSSSWLQNSFAMNGMALPSWPTGTPVEVMDAFGPATHRGGHDAANKAMGQIIAPFNEKYGPLPTVAQADVDTVRGVVAQVRQELMHPDSNLGLHGSTTANGDPRPRDVWPKLVDQFDDIALSPRPGSALANSPIYLDGKSPVPNGDRPPLSAFDYLPWGKNALDLTGSPTASVNSINMARWRRNIRSSAACYSRYRGSSCPRHSTSAALTPRTAPSVSCSGPTRAQRWRRVSLQVTSACDRAIGDQETRCASSMSWRRSGERRRWCQNSLQAVAARASGLRMHDCPALVGFEMVYRLSGQGTPGDQDRMPDYPVRQPWYDAMMREDPCRPLEPWMFEYYPSVLTVDASRHGPLTTWLEYGYLGVPPRVRAIVEELEPNLHQFIPVRVVYTQGKNTSIHPYYTLKINRCASVWDESHMQFGFENLIPGRPPLKMRVPGTPIAFKRSAIKGMHLWDQVRPESQTFISDQLHGRLDAEGLLSGKIFESCIVTN